MIDPNTIFTAITTRDGAICPELEAWLQAEDVRAQKNICNKNGYVAVAFNATVLDFLTNAVPKGKEYLIMLDDDLGPNDSMRQLWRADGDLIYCAFPTTMPNAKGHWGDGDLNAGAMRVHLRVLEAMRDGEGWFGATLADEGTRVTDCVCSWFRDKARRAGYESRMVGHVGHLMMAMARYDDQGNMILTRRGEKE